MSSTVVSSTTCNNFKFNRVGNHKRPIDKIITTSPRYAGFTRLHHACLQNNISMVRLLIKNSADVNIVAEDGTQPIHIACLLGHTEMVIYLVKSGANINAKISRAMFSKYVKNRRWCSDFGNEITLTTYAIVIQQRNSSLAQGLLQFENANFEKISRSNKTILRYAFDGNRMSAAHLIALKPAYKPFINTRDDDGFTDAHYLLHPKKYRNYRFVAQEMGIHDFIKGEFILLLMKAGADIYATVNGNPDTLLINMAAYRSSPEMLKKLLPCYTSINGSKALYYATLPLGSPRKYFHPLLNFGFWSRFIGANELKEQRRESKVLILKDLVNRITFGIPVPEEEKKLMETLYTTDMDVKNIIDDYKQHFIEGKLKQTVIKYGDNSISLYDLVLKSFNEKKFRLLVKNDTLVKALKTFFDNRLSLCYYLKQFLKMRINAARKRVKLLDELRKVSLLRKSIPLAYECVIEITEYLNNAELEKFISSFYTTSSVNLK